MDRQTTILRVTLLGNPSAAPVVTAEEVGQIVDNAAMADINGLAPSDPNWVPTWDTNGAVAEVWRIKAARCAGDFNFSADGSSFSKADVMAHCLEMEAKYAAMARGALGTIQVIGTAGPFNAVDRVAYRVIP